MYWGQAIHLFISTTTDEKENKQATNIGVNNLNSFLTENS